jgi:hypothetical protein
MEEAKLGRLNQISSRRGWKRRKRRGARTVARPELGLDAGALADEERQRGVARLDVRVVLLHELPAGENHIAA